MYLSRGSSWIIESEHEPGRSYPCPLVDIRLVLHRRQFVALEPGLVVADFLSRSCLGLELGLFLALFPVADVCLLEFRSILVREFVQIVDLG